MGLFVNYFSKFNNKYSWKVIMNEWLYIFLLFIGSIAYMSVMIGLTFLVTLLSTVYWEMKHGGGGFRE